MLSKQLLSHSNAGKQLSSSSLVDYPPTQAMEDLDFMLELANSMITLASVDGNGDISAGQKQLAEQGIKLLDRAIAFAPGATLAYILKARALQLFAQIDEAYQVLQRYCLS